jgi:hypothetical protein
MTEPHQIPTSRKEYFEPALRKSNMSCFNTKTKQISCKITLPIYPYVNFGFILSRSSGAAISQVNYNIPRCPSNLHRNDHAGNSTIVWVIGKEKQSGAWYCQWSEEIEKKLFTPCNQQLKKARWDGRHKWSPNASAWLYRAVFTKSFKGNESYPLVASLPSR